MKIIVTGGTGYIGAQTVLELSEKGYEIIVIDDLRSSPPPKSFHSKNITVVNCPLEEQNQLHQIFETNKIQAVIHFAGSIAVGESVKNPIAYYKNNVSNTLNLLHVMQQHGVNKIVFSSSAAVYGNTDESFLTESSKTLPVNPYGETKLLVEKILNFCDTAHNLKSVCLRYFNAAGADPDIRTGECHDPETHLIPLILKSLDNNDQINVFGNDYKTKDGTCIRDYVHVKDLAIAHVLAIEHLLKNRGSKIFNLGSGTGYSVQEVIRTAEQVTGIKGNVKIDLRRSGDSAVLVASAAKIKEELGWSPQFSDITTIIDHAWKWHQKVKKDKKYQANQY